LVTASLTTILGLTGITLILVRGDIFLPIRRRLEEAHTSPEQKPLWKRAITGWLHAIFTCPQCSGFWVGAFWQTMQMIHGCTFEIMPLLGIFVVGGLASIASVAANLLFSLANLRIQSLASQLDPTARR